MQALLLLVLLGTPVNDRGRGGASSAVDGDGVVSENLDFDGNVCIDSDDDIVEINDNLQVNESIYADGGLICPSAPTSDVAPTALSIRPSHNYAQGSQTAANLRLEGGLDEKYITVDDYTLGSTDTVTLTINSSDTTLTEGTDFDCDTSNDNCADNLATAIGGVGGVSSTAVGAVAYVTPDPSTLALTLAVSDGGADGAFGTVTNGTNGHVNIESSHLAMGADQRIYFDGVGGNDYIRGAAEIYIFFYVGGSRSLALASTYVRTDKPLLYKNITIAADDTTPSVSAGNVFYTSDNSGATEITDLDNPQTEQTLIICIGGTGANASTITDGGNFALAGDWTPGLDDCISLLVRGDNDYVELYRSDN